MTVLGVEVFFLLLFLSFFNGVIDILVEGRVFV